MKRLAIIPARGGSKRIPRKNIRSFVGKPIISYSISVALESGLFDEVMVSTDDKEIAAISKDFGATVPFFRSFKNADDYATTIDVIQEVISKYEQIGRTFEQAACIYPSAPFVTAENLIDCHLELERKGWDCIFPVIQYSYPIQRSLRMKINGCVEMNYPEFIGTRSQDLEKNYHDAGQFYFFYINALIRAKRLWTENTGCVIIPEMYAQDIDEESDWELAEIKFKYLKGRGLI